jgi:DNA-binding NtrC family response regulator
MDVLFVDDDEDVLFLMGDMLAKAGLRVRKAESGEAALDILRAGFLPDLVILDQNMPRMNGKQTMEHIRVLSPELPILISSGQPDIEDWDCFKRPKVAVIAKPFDMDEITAKMASFSR